MRPKWNRHLEAIDNLEKERCRLSKEGEPTSLRRYAAEEVMGMSSSVFEYEVRLNSLFRAYFKPEVDGRSSSYEIDDLVKHLGRMQDSKEVVNLLYHQYFLPKSDFKKTYENDYDYTFAEGTKTPLLGGIN